jgi:hypothetical protein
MICWKEMLVHWMNQFFLYMTFRYGHLIWESALILLYVWSLKISLFWTKSNENKIIYYYISE